MEKEKVAVIAEQLTGLTSSEWTRIKQVVDTEFNYRAAKVTLDDPKELKRRLGVEFNLRRFADKSD
ncbi:hypothetical protein ACTHOQ_14245 [Solibacillus silvestris]|uniref:hypothetical protein n=1 Tax=Solibacillus silvestris TaxID=76853 RepID=UPI003F7DA0B0